MPTIKLHENKIFKTKLQLQKTKSRHFICYKYIIELNHSDSCFLWCFLVTKEAQHQYPILIVSMYCKIIKITTNPWCLIGYIIYLIPLKYLSGLGFKISCLYLCKYALYSAVHFYRNFYSNNSTVFSWRHCDFHTSIMVSFLPAVCLDKNENQESLLMPNMFSGTVLRNSMSDVLMWWVFWKSGILVQKDISKPPPSRTLEDNNLVSTVWLKGIATLCSIYARPPTF